MHACMYVCMYVCTVLYCTVLILKYKYTVNKNKYTCSNPTYGVAARSLPAQQDPYIIEYSIPYIHTYIHTYKKE